LTERFLPVEEIEFGDFQTPIGLCIEITLFLKKNKIDSTVVIEPTCGIGNYFVNGYGEKVNIEEEYIFPLLKSSDIVNGRLEPRKYVLVTQRNVGDNTLGIKDKAAILICA
jgi:hypothetical protein